MNEVWRDIEGYEGKYRVSSRGRVMSTYAYHVAVRVKRDLTIKPFMRNGYEHVSLCKNGVVKKHKVHRLVAKLFVKNDNNKDCVNHKNGIKTDNTAVNLEWCTKGENNIHAVQTGLRGCNPIKGKRIIVLGEGGDKQVFISVSQAAKSLGISKVTIWRNMKNKNASTKGYLFNFE